MANTTRTESIQTAEGEQFDGTAVIPDGGDPGILLLQEIFGVGEFMLAKANDLASEGYVVLCPDVFWRVERGVALPHDESAMSQAFSYVERFGTLEPGPVAGDLLVGLAHLRTMPEVTGPSAVMGYCLGGRLGYEVAVAGDPDCCVSYYGSGIAARLEEASKITCPTIFHFGREDAFLPLPKPNRYARRSVIARMWRSTFTTVRVMPLRTRSHRRSRIQMQPDGRGHSPLNSSVAS
jgi:carboxymethylenebutenolidase